VTVSDQFTKEYKEARLGALRGVCNPIGKRHEDKEFPRDHPNAHLACYELKLSLQPPNVAYKDQFHPTKAGGLKLVRPWALCVPSNKERKVNP